MLQRVLLATFSNPLSSFPLEAFCPPFSHFDPFGTEFREPGRVSHPGYFCSRCIVAHNTLENLITKILPTYGEAPGVRVPAGI
jgi:hypothetical protein